MCHHLKSEPSREAPELGQTHDQNDETERNFTKIFDNKTLPFCFCSRLDKNQGVSRLSSPSVFCLTRVPTFSQILTLDSQKISFSTLEMIHFTGEIYENHVLQHLLPFAISKIFHFSRQKLVLR